MKTSETTPTKPFPTPRESKQDNSTPLSGAVVDSSATGAASEGGRKGLSTPTSTAIKWPGRGADPSPAELEAYFSKGGHLKPANFITLLSPPAVELKDVRDFISHLQTCGYRGPWCSETELLPSGSRIWFVILDCPVLVPLAVLCSLWVHGRAEVAHVSLSFMHSWRVGK